MRFLSYSFRLLARNRGRTILVVVGVSLSVAAIVFTYGLSAWVDILSSSSLTFALQGASIWVVPANGVEAERNTGLLVSRGVISDETVQELESVDKSVRFWRVETIVTKVADIDVVAYGDDRVAHGTSLVVASDVWQAMQAKGGGMLRNPGCHIDKVDVQTDLPAHSIEGPRGVVECLFGSESRTEWLVANTKDIASWSRHASEIPRLRVTSEPDASPNMQDVGATVYVVKGSLNRFDPFGFNAKFSAMTINSGLATLFGYEAKLVFILGLILSVTSSVLGVRERREEIAVFSVAGSQWSLFGLFWSEACLVQVACFVLGEAIGLSILWFMLGTRYNVAIGVEASAFALLYLPITIVLSTLIPGQMVARVQPSELLRADV